MRFGPIEPALVGGSDYSLQGPLDISVGDRPFDDWGQVCPALVWNRGSHPCRVMVLDGAAAGGSTYKLDEAQREKLTHVVARVRKRGAKFRRDLPWARDPIVKQAQNLNAKRMRIRLRQLRIADSNWHGQSGLPLFAF